LPSHDRTCYKYVVSGSPVGASGSADVVLAGEPAQLTACEQEELASLLAPAQPPVPVPPARAALEEQRELFEVSIRGRGTREARLVLRDALRLLAEQDPEFDARVQRHRVAWIVDSAPGTVSLESPDADRVRLVVESLGHSATVSTKSRTTPSRDDRNRARVAYLASLRAERT
jgi:hypothetical protein